MNFTMEELMVQMGALMDRKIDPINTQIRNLATKEDIQQIQRENNMLREENEQMRMEIIALRKEAKARDYKIVLMENESRKNNIIIGGLMTEGRNTKNVVTEFLVDTLGFERETPVVVSARVLKGRGALNANSSPILVTLLGQDDKEAIFQRGGALRNTGFWISSDYTFEIREKRRQLQIIRKILQRSTQGLNIKVSFDKLRIGREEFSWDQERGLLHRQGCGYTKIREMCGIDVEGERRKLEPQPETIESTERRQQEEAGGPTI
ncbi:hypothetical protein GE061_010128 [Apolygus lucorum]|uniref:Endonuclease-reverse transcriptase n=1 Tax=Apolygus lucorum TaxID=248454 RepID=A0A8S9Y4W0_APOLU|nr:hypothetical protein GE061_010128 [Apolygus lucorum]